MGEILSNIVTQTNKQKQKSKKNITIRATEYDIAV